MNEFLDLFLNLDQHLQDALVQYGAWTYGILFLIIFCETGLVVTPFLPGDSLLFAAGMFAHPDKGAFNLPVLMGLTSVGMQKMMPQSPDPMQRRMLQMMPIMFAFFAFSFPSGLVLYWVTNNILSMIQQKLMMVLKKKKTDGTPKGKEKDQTEPAGKQARSQA